MIIIPSTFTDYYDYIPKVYGIDKKVVLNRRIKMNMKLDDPRYPLTRFVDGQLVTMCFLSFCDDLFLIQDSNIIYRIDEEVAKSKLCSGFMYSRLKSLKSKIPNITKKVKFPYYTFCYANIHENVPNLSLLGLNKYYTPEQCYERIYYYMINVIHPSPDFSPPIELSDEGKINKHGFDNKTSFRPKMRLIK